MMIQRIQLELLSPPSAEYQNILGLKEKVLVER
jgi:hypothetical protein